MNLFEIKADIMKAYETAIDPETGEIVEESAFDALDELQMAFAEKVDNILCWVKDLKADAEALKAEKLAFAERQRIVENKIKSLEGYASRALNGEKFESVRAKASFRKSEQVAVDDITELDDEYLVFKDPEPDKMKIKKDLKAGRIIPGVHLEEKLNIQIK